MRYAELALALALAAALLAAGPARALPASTTDLWDVSQGTVVTGSTPIHFSSDARQMFGAVITRIESANTVFGDFEAAGSLDFIEWRTAAPVTLRSFNLSAVHDAAPLRNRYYRGMDRFSLFAFDGTDFAEIFSISFSGDLYDPLAANHPCKCQFVLEANVAAVTSDRFRAEFVQTGPPSDASGVRIHELDGYGTFFGNQPIPGTQVPEPSSLALFGLAVVALARGRSGSRRPRAFMPAGRRGSP
ncbi:MAG: PEP-CTERM sorting domain-containing protein [Burkholderiales bacterium]|nr:PEP-CTERM sorting domain-containing protein [Burkholderiales bacterium]